MVHQSCAGGDGAYYWVIRFNARPNATNEHFSWSIGKAFYEGDIFTREISAEQWQQELIREYDYVAIFRINRKIRNGEIICY